MNIRKQCFALMTALAVTCSGFSVLRDCVSADPVRPARKTDFAALLQAVPEQNNTEQFACLTFDAQARTLLRDGEDAGNAYAGFSAADGTLTVSREAVLTQAERESGCDASGTVSLDEAAERIGCTYFSENGRTAVCSPYQSGTLIVRADGGFDDGGAVSAADDGAGLYVLHYPTAADAYAACKALKQDAHVAFAEPDRIYSVCAETQNETDQADEKWGYDAVGCDAFTEMLDRQGNPADRLTVAVVDTGIYSAHNWFANRIAEGGCSFVKGRGSYEDDNSHGTLCAGIISRCTRENVKILPLKVLDQEGYGSTLQIYCAMLYAAEQGADVVSMSLCGTGESLLLQEAAQVLTVAGIPCIAAAGNQSWDVKYSNPGNLNQVIAVSAVSGSRPEQSSDPLKPAVNWELASYSNFGEKIDFTAPGTDIAGAGTGEPDAIRTDSGTSMAAPFVAACFANLLDDDRTRTTEQLCRILRMHALDLGEAGHDPEFGWGMVQLGNYLDADESCCKPAASAAGGIYSEMLNVSLSTETAGAEIYYTTDGSLPLRTNAMRYDGTPLLLQKSTELKAAAYLDDRCSPVLDEIYILTAPKPEVTPPAGFYTDAVSVQLHAAENTALYYTLDGSVPDPATAMRYTGAPVVLDETAVICAVSVFGETVSEPVYAGYNILGEHPERLLHVEDSVLTGCYGSFITLDLTEMPGLDAVTAIAPHAFAGQRELEEIVLPDSVVSIGEEAFSGCRALRTVAAGHVTAIGAGAFRSCENLDRLELGALDAVPARAFYHCKQLKTPEYDTAKIRSVGEYAFADSGFSGKVDFSSLETVGAYAFADLHKLTLTLPETVTVLPDGVFCNTGPLDVSAKGAVRIGKRAFCNDAFVLMQNIDIPFERIKSIGAEAFKNVNLNASAGGEIIFASAEWLGNAAFFCAACRAMSFPLLRTVPKNAFSGVEADVLAFESAETFCSGAVSPDMQHPCCVIVSASLRRIENDALSVPGAFAAVAAPPDSEFAAYANANGLPFRAIPDLYLAAHENADGSPAGEQLTAIPLGFGMQVTWNAAGSLPVPPEQEPVRMLYPYQTDVADGESVQAALWKDGILLRRSGEQTVTAERNCIAAEIAAPDQPVCIDWYALYTEQERIRMIRSGYHADCLFTAPHSGSYYIFSDADGTAVTVHNDDNEPFVQAAGAGRTVPPEPVFLQGGETVRIRIEAADLPAYSFLFITETAPVYDLHTDAVLQQDWTFMPYSEPAPEPEIRVTLRRDPDTVLKEKRDYLLLRTNQPAVGKNTVFAVGIGQYTGVLQTAFALTKQLSEDAPETVGAALARQPVYTFTAKQSGTHTFWMMLPENTLSQIAESGKMDSFSTWIYVYHADGSFMEYDSECACGCAVTSCEMQAGESYLVTIGCDDDRTVPEMELHVSSGSGKQHMILTNMTQNTMPFGDPDVLPAIDLQDAGGRKLTEGKDYLRIPLDPVLPGDMHNLLIGKGDYYGISDCVLHLNYDAAQAVPIRIDEPFSVEGCGGIFRLELEDNAAVQAKLTVPDGAAVRAGMYQEGMLDAETMNRRLKLVQDQPAHFCGSCDIVLVPEDGKPHTCILSSCSAQTDIGKAFCETEDLVFTGEPLLPKLHITFGGKELTEQKDYILSYPDEIVSCGSHRVYVIGINDFTGSADVMVTVMPPEPDEIPVLSGENQTEEITRAGQTLLRRWTAPADRICLRKESLPDAEILLYQKDGLPLGSCRGIGEKATSVSVKAMETYYIMIRMTEAEAVGTVQFSLLTDCVPLYTCSVSGETVLAVTDPASHPEITVTDGAYVLREGVDYYIQESENPPHIGWNVVRICGMGHYIGEQEFGFICAPPFSELDHSGGVTALTLDQDASAGNDVPGTTELFSFTAPKTDSYYLHVTAREICACTVLRYGTDGEVLPAGRICFPMEKGETVFFAVISDWPEIENAEPEDCVIGLTTEMPEICFDLDGYSYLTAKDGTFSVIGLPPDCCGYVLPEYVTDPETGVTARFLEIFGGLTWRNKDIFVGTVTIYGEPDGNVKAFCDENEYSFALLDPECKVRGDLTGDGIADQHDVLMLQRWLTECGGMLLPGKAAQAADLDGDGCVTMCDLCEIMQIVYTENPES